MILTLSREPEPTSVHAVTRCPLDGVDPSCLHNSFDPWISLDTIAGSLAEGSVSQGARYQESRSICHRKDHTPLNRAVPPLKNFFFARRISLHLVSDPLALAPCRPLSSPEVIRQRRLGLFTCDAEDELQHPFVCFLISFQPPSCVSSCFPVPQLSYSSSTSCPESPVIDRSQTD